MEYHGIFTQIHPLTANLQDMFESSPYWRCRILSVTKACMSQVPTSHAWLTCTLCSPICKIQQKSWIWTMGCKLGWVWSRITTEQLQWIKHLDLKTWALILTNGRFQNRVFPPKSYIFMKVFLYKPSILGYPICLETFILCQGHLQI